MVSGIVFRDVEAKYGSPQSSSMETIRMFHSILGGSSHGSYLGPVVLGLVHPHINVTERARHRWTDLRSDDSTSVG